MGQQFTSASVTTPGARGCYRDRCVCRTVRSHIVPRAFAKLMRTPGRGRLGRWSMQRVSIVQGMLFDDDLLCAACDVALGPLDNTLVCFVRATRDQVRRGAEAAPHLDLPGFDPRTVQRAVLSVIWRAAISGQSTFEDVTLAPYTKAVERCLYNASIPPPPALDVWAHVLTGRNYPLSGYTRYPVAMDVAGVACWSLVVCGVAFLVRREPAPLPPQFAAYRLGAMAVPRLQCIPYVDTLFRHQVDSLTGSAAGRRRRREVTPFGSAAAVA